MRVEVILYCLLTHSGRSRLLLYFINSSVANPAQWGTGVLPIAVRVSLVTCYPQKQTFWPPQAFRWWLADNCNVTLQEILSQKDSAQSLHDFWLSESLGTNKCTLLSAAKFWGKFLCHNKQLMSSPSTKLYVFSHRIFSVLLVWRVFSTNIWKTKVKVKERRTRKQNI